MRFAEDLVPCERCFLVTAASCGGCDFRARDAGMGNPAPVAVCNTGCRGNLKRILCTSVGLTGPVAQQRHLQQYPGFHLGRRAHFSHMFKFGSDPRQWLEKCSRGKGVQDGDRLVRVLRVCNGIPWCDGAYDQMSLSSLANIETASRHIQSIGDACPAVGSAGPGCGPSKLLSGCKPPDDLVSPFPRSCDARRGREEVELHSARSKMLELRTVPSYEAAGAVAGSAFPAPGGRARGRKCDKGRGRGLKPPGEA